MQELDSPAVRPAFRAFHNMVGKMGEAPVQFSQCKLTQRYEELYNSGRFRMILMSTIGGTLIHILCSYFPALSLHPLPKNSDHPRIKTMFTKTFLHMYNNNMLFQNRLSMPNTFMCTNRGWTKISVLMLSLPP